MFQHKYKVFKSTSKMFKVFRNQLQSFSPKNSGSTTNLRNKPQQQAFRKMRVRLLGWTLGVPNRVMHMYITCRETWSCKQILEFFKNPTRSPHRHLPTISEINSKSQKIQYHPHTKKNHVQSLFLINLSPSVKTYPPH